MEKTFKAVDLMRKSIGMQDFSRLVHISHYILMTESVEGDIVEFGCYRGDTAKLITHITSKKIYVYDSFSGLPHPIAVQLPNGQYLCVDKMDVGGSQVLVSNFKQDNLPVPIITEKYFDKIHVDDLPSRISFAHIDCDLYSSTLSAISLIYERVSPGGVILVDDYYQTKWAGVKKAIEEFLEDKVESVVELPSCVFEQKDRKCIIYKK